MDPSQAPPDAVRTVVSIMRPDFRRPAQILEKPTEPTRLGQGAHRVALQAQPGRPARVRRYERFAPLAGDRSGWIIFTLPSPFSRFCSRRWRRSRFGREGKRHGKSPPSGWLLSFCRSFISLISTCSPNPSRCAWSFANSERPKSYRPSSRKKRRFTCGSAWRMNRAFTNCRGTAPRRSSCKRSREAQRHGRRHAPAGTGGRRFRGQRGNPPGAKILRPALPRAAGKTASGRKSEMGDVGPHPKK